MAQADYFLKIDGIDGESIDKGHEKWIELESWSWGESNAGSGLGGTGGGSGKVAMQDFSFGPSRTGKASPKLMLACATGQHIAKAQLACRKAGGKQEVFLTVTLENVLVSSYSMSGHDAGGNQTTRDQVSLNFTKIDIRYRVPATGEVVETFYDQIEGVGGFGG